VRPRITAGGDPTGERRSGLRSDRRRCSKTALCADCRPRWLRC